MNITNRTSLVMVMIICLLLLSSFVRLSAVSQESGAASIDWSVIGGGSMQVQTGYYSLDGTSGQAVVGQAINSHTELCTGFWCGTEVAFKVYLPIFKVCFLNFGKKQSVLLFWKNIS